MSANLPNKMIFSLDTMSRCSGDGSDDRNYAVFFCKEAITRAEATRDKLAAIAFLEAWDDNVRTHVESLLGYVNALYSSISSLVETFDRVPSLLAPMKDAATILQGIHADSKRHAEIIRNWLDQQA